MSALDVFADAQRWVAWRNEKHGDKCTKMPYGADGKPAKANDPGTWLTRGDAIALAKRITNGLGGGSSIALGPLENGFVLVGVDLDTCRSEDGALTPWAMEIIDRFATYTEISPSGSGVKLFWKFCETDFSIIEPELGDAKTGKQFKQPGGGHHPPGIEIYFRCRVFAVTEQHLAGTPEELAVVPIETVLWLLREAGPALAGKSERKDKTGFDNSRSAEANRIGWAMCFDGKSLAEFREAVRIDPKTEGWYREWSAKGEAALQRQLDNIWNDAVAAKAKQADAAATDLAKIRDEVVRLASLDELEYHRVRKEAAKELGLSVGYLDKKVRAARGAPDHDRKAGQLADDRLAKAVVEMNRSYAVVLVAGKAAILHEYIDPDNHRPTYGLMSIESLRLMLANRFVAGASPAQQTPLTEVWVKHSQRRTYDGLVFRPNREAPRYYNLWRGFSMKPSTDGSCEKFKRHYRLAQPGHIYYRFAHFVFPFWALFPNGPLTDNVLAQGWVPMDDTHTMAFTFSVSAAA